MLRLSIGTKLFILYNDDMVNASKIFRCIVFADNKNLFRSSKDFVNLSVSFCNELMELEKWFVLNSWSLNSIKAN